MHINNGLKAKWEEEQVRCLNMQEEMKNKCQKGTVPVSKSPNLRFAVTDLASKYQKADERSSRPWINYLQKEKSCKTFTC